MQRLAAALPLLFLVGCDQAPQPERSPTPQYVTSASCARCHGAETEAWSGSHHDLAMQEPSAASVLGNFDDAVFRLHGTTTRFSRRGDEFWVRIEERDGTTIELPVRYTFGFDPLQQVLVEPEPGRLQALTIAWDTRPAGAGGQRWFSLHPDDPTPAGDVLHWNGVANRWNSMCAHCHSTNVRKGFDLARGVYATTWSEVDVGCEACHGPGGAHVAWAEGDRAPDLTKGLVTPLPHSEARWAMHSGTGIAQLDRTRDARPELENCAACHSRRSLLAEGIEGRYHDRHRLALLEDGLYFADGQMRDEVYVYGSFLQSKMYVAGVRCSDCHEPHSLKLRGTTESVCAQCHAPERFASPEHHRHETDSAGASCIACHMPARTYMEVDVRRDHSFRVPRPRQSASLGSPDVCAGCHAQQSPQWAAEIVASWRPGPRTQSESSSIVRATDLAHGTAENLPSEIRSGREHPDPLVRLAAATASERVRPEERADLIRPLLSDPARSVRLEAAFALAGTTKGPELDAALTEYVDAQRLNADEPSAHVNLGLLYQRLGELDRAEGAYRQAIAVGNYFLPAFVNLADLQRSLGREDAAHKTLQEGLSLHPSSPALLHALGLALVRQSRLGDALAPLAQAAALAPESPHFAYVSGVALHSAGETPHALEVLRRAHLRHPTDPRLLEALAAISRDAGQIREAEEYARRRAALGSPG